MFRKQTLIYGIIIWKGLMQGLGKRILEIFGTNMPIQKCKLKSGKPGWKWGKSGKCYSKRDDALNQMKAIHASQNRVRASGRNR